MITQAVPFSERSQWERCHFSFGGILKTSLAVHLGSLRFSSGRPSASSHTSTHCETCEPRDTTNRPGLCKNVA
jgi:hypothetical protein